MEILFDNRQNEIEMEWRELQAKARSILEELGYRPTSILSISVVNATEMADLNWQYRRKKGPTNVLSFAQHEGPEAGANSDLLGDVVICAERVREDAESLGYTLEEMSLYVLIHGILHLTGYTHKGPQDTRNMEARVNEIFAAFCPAAD